MLSIVIPVHNEERSILPLYDRLTVIAESLHRAYEIIFVDDASTDRSFESALEIDWPSRLKQRLTNIAANQFIIIEEGKGITAK
jgi:glycosyltransferase involved in cell wall biosynthesis